MTGAVAAVVTSYVIGNYAGAAVGTANLALKGAVIAYAVVDAGAFGVAIGYNFASGQGGILDYASLALAGGAGVSDLKARKALKASKGGFGANGLYRAPTGMADEAVKTAYLKEVDSLSFRVKLGAHNLLTPFHKRTTVAAVREAVETGAFGRGPFTVKALADGRKLFGGTGTRTFLNRQFFHHELIHVSQMIKNPNLWSDAPLRILHEFVQLPTAHGATFWPAAILTGWWIAEATDVD